MSYVILECGSVARGDTNMRSDRDLVCIWSDNPPIYSNIERIYGETMFYSLECIGRMRKKGSLFLTHLDIDSRYLDGDKTLVNIFKGYRPPRKLVERSLLDTIDFISKIKWFPDSVIGGLWLCDVLYVSLRNCIYCKNALNGCYLFGYEDSLKQLHLSSSDISVMLSIRESKYLYRSSEDKGNELIDVKKIESVCSSILDESVGFILGGITQWSGDWRMDYWGERLVERAILNGECSDYMFLEKIKHRNYNRFALKSEVINILKGKLLQ